MSTSHGCNDGKDVVELFTEALKQRVGQECFQIWFTGIRFEYLDASDQTLGGAEDVNVPLLDAQSTEGQSTEGQPSSATALAKGVNRKGKLVAIANGQFAADRLSKNYLSAIRGAAASACGPTTTVAVEVDATPPRQVELPFDGSSDDSSSQLDRESSDVAAERNSRVASRTSEDVSNRKRRSKKAAGRGSSYSNSTQSLHAILQDGTNSRKPKRATSNTPRPAPGAASVSALASPLASARPDGTRPSNDPQTLDPSQSGRPVYSWESFVGSDCNQLARTACQMAIQSPAVASPLVLWGPAGSGKTHLLHAVASKLRGIHRMRRVVYLSAEEFTNDFIRALNGNSLPAFRARFRDVDALLIDDIQFFVDKKATIRELHHTIEMLAEFRKPLLFAGTKAPTEITGLGSELAGRLSSGLVCQVQSLDDSARSELLSRFASERCQFDWPVETLKEIAELAEGDGRVLSGIANLVALLQQMYGQMPSMDQIRQHGSHLLRSAGVPITLSAIERAVEKVFQLESKVLQSGSQTKSVTEPRMLAMYLARELTSSAFSEIGGHFGGRSHSTAILANQRVGQWLDANKAIGRGRAAIAAEDAIRQVQSMLKTG